MKYLKSVDFAGQSIVLLILCAAIPTVLVHDVRQWEDGLFLFLYAQLFLGPWQLASASLSLLFKFEFYQARRIHFFLSLTCLALIGGSFWLHDIVNSAFTRPLFLPF